MSWRQIIFLLTTLVLVGCTASVPKFVSPSSLTSAPSPTLSPSPSPSPSPTPRPLTFAEMQARYGPCVTLPTLMYHHIQDQDAAAASNQTYLTVIPDTFRSHLQYLRDTGYQLTSPPALINFFDTGIALPPKSVLLTFDDGYADFYTNVFPLLREFGFPATVFLATGLVDNPGYLSWNQIAEMAGQNIYFANHTWSHKNVATVASVVEQEISTAQIQLEDHGFNSSRVFAYPYGLGNGIAQNYLATHNYFLAFTTLPGRILCRGQRLTLPRIRVGNSRLDNYLP